MKPEAELEKAHGLNSANENSKSTSNDKFEET